MEQKEMDKHQDDHEEEEEDHEEDQEEDRDDEEKDQDQIVNSKHCQYFLSIRGCKKEDDCDYLHAIPQNWVCRNCGVAGDHLIQNCPRGYCTFYRQGTCTHKKCCLPHTKEEFIPKKCNNCNSTEHLLVNCTSPCRWYLKNGSCEKGDLCLLKHGHGHGHDGNGKQEVKARAPRSWSDEMDEKKTEVKVGKKPCKFYARGHCDKGKHCTFAHTVGSSHSQSISSHSSSSPVEEKTCYLCGKEFNSMSQMEQHKKGKIHRCRLQVQRLNKKAETTVFTGKNCLNCGDTDHEMRHCPVRFCRQYVNRECKFGSECVLEHLEL